MGVSTVTPRLSDTGFKLSENLIYPTLSCESPSLRCVETILIYHGPTPGLSDKFYEGQVE
jgi:hypothetical protein